MFSSLKPLVSFVHVLKAFGKSPAKNSHPLVVMALPIECAFVGKYGDPGVFEFSIPAINKRYYKTGIRIIPSKLFNELKKVNAPSF